jgi:hypothetical protein
MSSSLIDLAKALTSATARVRGALSESVLDTVWKSVVDKGDGPGMPLAPDAREPSYWTRRKAPLQVPERYEKQY